MGYQGNGWTLNQKMLETITCKSFLSIYDRVCAENSGVKFVKDSESSYRMNLIKNVAKEPYEAKFATTFDWDPDLEIKIRKYPLIGYGNADPIGILFGPGEMILPWSDDLAAHGPDACSDYEEVMASMEEVVDLIDTGGPGHFLNGRLIADILNEYKAMLCTHGNHTVAQYYLEYPNELEKLIRYALGNRRFAKNVKIETYDDSGYDHGAPRYYEIDLKPGTKDSMHTWTIRLPAYECPVRQVYVHESSGKPTDIQFDKDVLKTAREDGKHVYITAGGPGCYPPCPK